MTKPRSTPPANPGVATPVELVVFGCEGREHLLSRTIAASDAAIAHPFRTRRVIIDGKFDNAAIAFARPDAVYHQVRRAGYVQAARAALRQVRTEYFFWLEDDWSFAEPVDVGAMLAALEANPDWVQVRLSKTGPLDAEQKREPLGEDFFRSNVGFSANPSLFRTAPIREAFEALDSAPRGYSLEADGFEVFVSNWLQEHGFTCAVLDSAGVSHEGYIESTPREWHMTGSLDAGPDRRLFALGKSPPMWRRILMIGKLARRLATVALRQLRSDQAYELAFRIVTAAPPPR